MAALQNRSTQGRVFRKLECKGQKFVKLTFPTTANEFTSLHASICPVLRTTPAPCKSGAEELRFPRAAQLLLPGRGSGEPVHQSLSPHAQGWLSPPQMYGFPETFTCCLSCHDRSWAWRLLYPFPKKPERCTQLGEIGTVTVVP